MGFVFVFQAAMPYRKQVNAKPLKSSSSAVTSSTAKRILDTLEMMATPLSVSLLFLLGFNMNNTKYCHHNIRMAKMFVYRNRKMCQTLIF